ncbi:MULTISPECIES: type II toxin-antitoxin system VapC family toxin [Protofrankia]|uniref:PilT protein domain protein n=1 Tax=Candidatus Protofrankia datiscae TaxID=2716812 RepID=F8B3Y7_9ACTN|nr:MULTISPECIES: type II toxin-antitoxin system VapC family toxin [Protofrankia]AEH09999.1 PilT protein domain protein [Candidatus Protofrankia datiscae]
MSRYLLDTQAWLWSLAEPRRLRADTRDLLADTANEILLSAASGWEISIKYRLGKLALPEPPRGYVPDRIRRTGVIPLAVEHDHVLRVAELPDHHRDPFDRLLVAQAQALNVPLITADGRLSAYEVKTLPA